MKYPYERLTITEELPFFMLMTSVKYIAMHWHDRIEFILVLKGSVHFYVQKEKYTLKESDLLFVNSNEVHGVESNDENRLIVLQIPLSFVQKYYKNIEKEEFSCQSFLHSKQEDFHSIKTSLVQMMLLLKTKGECYDIKLHSLLLDLIYNLITNFRVEKKKSIHRNHVKNIDRLTRITNYIQENYMHPLTLNEIAENEQLSVPYLSKYFQQQMGQPFIKYLNSIRLEHAVRYLIETEMPVIEVAIESGFASMNTFHKLFKEIFQTTPHQYRKIHQTTSMNYLPIEKKGIASYKYNEEDGLDELKNFLIKVKN